MAKLHREGFNLRNPAIFHRIGIPGSGGPDWLRGDYEWIVATSRKGKLPWSDNTACGAAPKWEPGKSATSGKKNGDTQTLDAYQPPEKANPGNVVERTYTASEVRELLAQHSDYRHHIVGGGHMGGDEFASQNEAPFPEPLAEFFVLSFCRPDGIVCDPFSGSGTVAAMAKRHNRNFVGCDLRQSQVDLALKRCGEETPMMFST
jgi:hypothetical protein